MAQQSPLQWPQAEISFRPITARLLFPAEPIVPSASLSTRPQVAPLSGHCRSPVAINRAVSVTPAYPRPYRALAWGLSSLTWPFSPPVLRSDARVRLTYRVTIGASP